ncbi:MAG: hypothetical protein RL154_56 [Pseudomonadota bacterium]|jgi:DNA-binding response OmpR family regulator
MQLDFSVLKNKTILLAEDEKPILDVLAKLLSNFFANVLKAKDGEEAFLLYVAHKPDLILSDIHMPNLNGLEFAAKVRETDQQIPIVFLSAYSEYKMLLKAVNTMVDGYLIKPADCNSILDTCCKALLRNSLQTNSNIVNICKNLTYNTTTKQYLLNNSVLVLGKKEYELLGLLTKVNGETIGKDEIILSLYSYETISDNALKSVINRLRAKIGEEYIVNVKGIGWRLNLQ